MRDRRIIINVRDESLSDGQAADAVGATIAQGKQSTTRGIRHYAHATVFRNGVLGVPEDRKVVVECVQRHPSTVTFYVFTEAAK